MRTIVNTLYSIGVFGDHYLGVVIENDFNDSR